MATVDIREFHDTFVIHFGGEYKRLNAYTLATALVGFADAAKAANAATNPGYDVQVVVEALGPGSFRATVRALYTSARNLFSNQSLKAIVLSIIASYIYQHTLAPDQSIVISIQDDEVIIQQGDTRIIVPRTVHEAVKALERNPEFEKGVCEVVEAIESDPDVTSIGLSPSPDAPVPPVEIPRERFTALPLNVDRSPREDERERFEETSLVILRAILERSRRRWEFVWNGVRISAPVTDDRFYDKFFNHQITVAPGDMLLVRLRIRQKRKPDLPIFVNDSYEIVEVLEHVSGMQQECFGTSD
jgi:hypothetical protein